MAEKRYEFTNQLPVTSQKIEEQKLGVVSLHS